LAGQKGDVFEGGIRVPFIVSWPARLPAGGTYAQPVIALDILLFLTGSSPAAPHPRLFWRMDGGEAFAVREGRWKWLRTYNNPPQLYDLSTDIGETRDLASTQPEISSRLAAAAAEWNHGLIAPAFGNNPFGGLINRTRLEKDAAP